MLIHKPINRIKIDACELIFEEEVPLGGMMRISSVDFFREPIFVHRPYSGYYIFVKINIRILLTLIKN